MNKKQLCRMTGFLLLVCMMISGLNWLLRDRATTLSALYSEQEDTVDVAIVGSSHVNSGYMPALLWGEYNISACNVFSWSQPLWVSYHYIQEALRTQSPAVVVLDLNGLLYGNSFEQPEATDQTSYVNSFNMDMSLNFLQAIGTVDDCGIDLRDPIDFLPLVKYHTRWKVLDEAAFTYDPHQDYDYMHGYGFQVLTHPLEKPSYPATDAREEPYETAVEYLEKIVQLSGEKGFSLVFVLAPYDYQENEPAIFNWIDDYSAAHDIPFLNYCTDDGERIGLDWSADFCDARHVNYRGAIKLTRDLGQFLLEQGYPLRSRSQLPNAQRLDLDSQMQQRVIDIWEHEQAGLADFLTWAVENGQVAVAAGGNAHTLSPSVFAALQAAGFTDVTHLQTPGASYAALSQNGEVQQAADDSGAAVTAGDGLLTAASQGSVTFSASLQCGTYQQTTDTIGILYYDPLLGRPVYWIAPDATGQMVFTDLGADLEF